jgi:dephospho-CoA kinase
MKSWQKYEQKLKELKDYLENSYNTSPDIEVSLILPNEKEIPYVLVRYYIDDERFHERKIELFEYYLEKDIREVVSMITAIIEEFATEIEQSEYGGG